MSKNAKWDDLENAGKDAALSENHQSEEAVQVRSKTIKTIPANYFTAHEQLKKDGKTGLLFTAYILEAIREKLERDGGL